MKNDLLPCEVNARATCATCNLHNNGCPIETMCGALGAYEIVKAFHPVKTTANAGANVQELIKEKFPKQYNDLQLSGFDWVNDLDGILDFLYGERDLGLLRALYGISKADIIGIIKLIEVRVLSISGHYKDRGASVYERCYLDVVINEQATPPPPPSAKTETLITTIKTAKAEK